MDITKKMAVENTGEVPTCQFHRFRFRFNAPGESEVEVSCTSCGTSCGTVLQALETSCEFKDRNLREGTFLIEIKKKGYIVPHFPCKLIGENELLVISVEKTSGEASKETQIPKPKDESEKLQYESDKLITFYMKERGGKNMIKKPFLKNSKLKSNGHPLYIFAINGETLQDALQRDGRLSNFVFGKKYYFTDVDSDASLTVEFSLKADSLNGRRFEICMKTEERGGKKLSSDLTPVVGPPQPSTSIKPEGTTNSKSPKTCKEEGTARKLSFSKRQECVMPDYDELLNILRNQFGPLVEQMMKNHNKKTYSSLLSQIRGTFGKRSSGFSTCHSVSKLLMLARSVCKIYAAKQGTGFLLFDRYILTNAHLFENNGERFIDDQQKLLCEVMVTFEIENLDSDDVNVERIPVKRDLLDFQLGLNYFQQYVDYAVLELEDHVSFNGLLCQYGHEPKSGDVCIFGHPDGHKKKMDFTIVIEGEKRIETLKTRMGEGINSYYLRDDLNRVTSQKTNIVTYDTSLFHGASGGPVFDDSLQVIGMHTGGLPYEKDSTKSFIEYAIPIRTILQNFLINMTIGNKEKILVKFTKQATTFPFLLQVITTLINYIIQNCDPSDITALKLWKTVMESEECNPKVFTDLKNEIDRQICNVQVSDTPSISENWQMYTENQGS
ncbi:serine protease FAM111A-like [Hypomesus transpacificus]|uniref:serine protease FAM111A-like n=1 Tax=Hypomesus transpacificus TaxID=137520 RepID=UPI001F07D6EC|nr:serine protease FAM111A-like [Hypomesus transpacificus]